MTIAYWCVLAAAFVPYVFTLFAKSGARYDNHAPREFLEKREGKHKRAHWAQLNGFEAFPPFAAAVIIAHLAGGAQDSINLLAVAFVALRLAYGFAYMADKAILRSILWALGLLCVISLFIIAA